MYRPPFDNEQPSDNPYDGDQSGKYPSVPPRQSAVPHRLVEKQRKAFYTDEHPEIPKVRRASLKQEKIETDPRLATHQGPGGSETAPQVRLPRKLIREARLFFGDEPNEREQSKTFSYPGSARRKSQQTMLPLTGLESASEIREWQQETGYHQRISLKKEQDEQLPFPDDDGQLPFPEGEEGEADTAVWEKLTRQVLPSARHKLTQEVLPAAHEKFNQQILPAARRVAQYTESMSPLRIPRRKPGSGDGPTTSHSGIVPRSRFPFLDRKQKRILLITLTIFVLILAPLIVTNIGAHNGRNNSGQSYTLPGLPPVASNPHELIVTPPNTDHPAPPIFATSAYLLDADHEATLYTQNPFLHLPMLSTTKLMTASLAVEKGNLDQQVTISPEMQQDINNLSADSALFGVKQGETYTLRDLIYGLLYFSGNDAALVIANAVGGSVPNFVAEMNQKAQELGMLDTHFVNPHGLLNDGQYSCAHDLAVLGQYSLSIPTLQQISSGRTYHITAGGNHDARVILNENQFLWWYPGATGGKTGFDGVSDFVQVMSVTRNNHHLIGVVMHTNNWWTDMRDLMNYGSTDYTWSSPRDTEAAGQVVPYDNLWNYFASDTQQYVIPMGVQGRYYVYSGYTVSGPILDYFDQQGGLQKFGFPTKMALPSGGTLLTQQFQHGSIQCDTSNQQCHSL